jgi:dephospho-CoA kinase
MTPEQASDPQSSILNPRSSKPVLGLIGGMGSGKSLIAAHLARRGGRLIVGDQIGHEALRQPDIRGRVVARFGPGILAADGREIDRRKLGAVVFADPARRQALEAIVFPWIERRIREEMAEARADPAVRFVVLDAAILLEAGWNSVCDSLVYVDAPREVRMSRLAAQRNWTPEEVEAREKAQMPLEEKRGRADFVIDNSGPPDDALRQADGILGRLGVG